MCRCTGIRPELAVLALAVVSACVSEPDVTLRVTRPGTHPVQAMVCDLAMPAVCGDDDSLVTEGMPEARVRTLGIYLDAASPPITVRFQQLGNPNVCHRLMLPLTGLPIDVELALPATQSVEWIVPTDTCPGCDSERCP